MESSYLQRYLNGEHEAVWRELVALGAAVRQEPIYSDARAVANETMRRARHNVEKLYENLRGIGYTFQLDAYTKMADNAPRLLRELIQANPLYQSLMKTAFADMDEMEASFSAMRDANREREDSPYPKPFIPARPTITAQLDQFEREIGAIPLSIRAWCETVGSVNFNGTHPGLNESLAPADLTMNPLQMLGMLMEQISNMTAGAPVKGLLGDPLMIDFEALHAGIALDTMQDEEYIDAILEREALAEGAAVPYYVEVSISPAMKGGQVDEGQYEIRLPAPTADTPLLNADTTFVGYLRKSFAWGGFPGLANYPGGRDEALLAKLRDGLLPL